MDTARRTDAAGRVVLEFQSVMEQFLEVERRVFDVYVARKGHGPRAIGAAPEVFALPTGIAAARPEPITIPEGRQPVAVPAPVTGPASVAIGAPVQALRLTPRPVPRPASGARATLAPGGVVLLTDDGTDLCRHVAGRLQNAGHRVAIISLEHMADPERQIYHSPLDSEAEVGRIVDVVSSACGPIAALVHLLPLTPAPRFDDLDGAGWSLRLSAEIRTLFLLTKTLRPSLEAAATKGGAFVVAATAMGGAFGCDAARHADSIFPGHGGITGFMKCLALEWPKVRARTIDLDATEPLAARSEHVFEELWIDDQEVEIGYAGGTRVALELTPAPARTAEAFAIPSDAVVLATGGARGITAEVCVELAERYQPTFVLVGQSPPPSPTEPRDVVGLTTDAELKRALIGRLQAGGARVTPASVEKAYRQLRKEREIRETISRLTAAGARTHYVQLDVQDEQAFGALIDEIYTMYGRLDGVIHGAGVIEDKLVRDKPVESFDRVLRTKAMSAFVLSRHLKPESLRFVVFFSSVAGRFGNRGQADYAAANEVVSKLAATLQGRWPARVCSIAWAPWDKLGMVSPELKREFARRGVELLSPAAGRRALVQEIQQGPEADAEIVVTGRAATSLATGLKPERLPLLKHATREWAQADVVRFVRHLDPRVDLYLRDHRLDGHPTLPLAFATELMAEAAQAASPNLRVVAVRDLQLLKGIVVDPAPVPVMVTARKAVHDNEDGLTEVAVEISTPGLSPRARYRSVVQMASRGAAPPSFDLPPRPVAALSRSLAKAYEDWTFHGPLFQRITGIAGMGADAMVGTVYSPSASPVLDNVASPEWIIDPFVFDAALQFLLMWSRAQHDMTALPSRFRSLVRYAPLSDEPLTCYVAVKSQAGGHALKSTVHFVDADGRVLALLDAMEVTCTSALNRLAIAERDGSRQ